MKVSLSWLKDYLDTSASPVAIADALVSLGLEVDAMTNYADSLKDFTIAHVVATAPHPNADSLQLCTVDTFKGTQVVVCGAANACAGIAVIYAAEGMIIPHSGIALKKATIRGVDSAGMLLSAEEMGIAGDKAGIITLSTDIPVGTAATVALGLDDVLFDVSVTPNRADCLGVYGIARDLSAIGIGTLKPMADILVDIPTLPLVSPTIGYTINRAIAPYTLLLPMAGVQHRESPAHIKNRLISVGITPKGFLVDITNYMTIAFARPVHCYALSEAARTVRIDFGKGESFLALNGKSYVLSSAIPVVYINDMPAAIAGIMGGAAFACMPDTTNVLIEVALFDPIVISKAGQALDIISDARQRFERGVDGAFLSNSMGFVAASIQKVCGGSFGSLYVDGAPPLAIEPIVFPLSSIMGLLGIPIAQTTIQSYLVGLGCVVTVIDSATLSVIPPSWRHDIHQPVDLVEEVLRLYGVDSVPAVPLPSLTALPPSSLSPKQGMVRLLRRHLAQMGMVECVSMTFISAMQAIDFPIASDGLYLENPISQDLAALRPSVLPSLLEFVRTNANRGYDSLRLFEIGAQFNAPRHQEYVAAGILSGAYMLKDSHGTAQRVVDVYDAKQVVLSLLATCSYAPESLSITTDVPSWYHPGQAGAIMLGSVVVGYFGVLHPLVLDHHSITTAVVGFELFLDRFTLPVKASSLIAPLALASLQPVHRDFAFIVDSSVLVGELLHAVRQSDIALISAVRVFDVYVGGSIATGKKSVALTVTLQPTVALTDSDLLAISDTIVATTHRLVGAVLRI